MRSTALVSCLIIPSLVSFASAKPKIEFESKTVNCGIAIENKTEKINAVFVLKNTGDEVLKIESVRPGCGCTVVKFDSLIPPGKSSKIESVVNIAGYHSGPISKSITVTSNAANEPTVRLTIEATIQAPIDISVSYLTLPKSAADSAQIIYLASKKTDLKITNMEFRAVQGGSDVPAWQSNVPMQVKYKMLPLDSIRGDGYKVYKLAISPLPSDKSMNGEFIIETNHPDKKELSVRGRIGG